MGVKEKKKAEAKTQKFLISLERARMSVHKWEQEREGKNEKEVELENRLGRTYKTKGRQQKATYRVPNG